MHLCLPLVACTVLVQGPAPSTAPSPAQEPPALVVLVVCDQLIPEQLDRLAPWLDGGFARFWDQGRSYRRATLSYARTETGPGHASVSTGSLPNRHGIVGNQFFDRALGKTIYCMTDTGVRALTSAGPAESGSGSSPHYITAPTLAETLLAADSASRIFSVSMKDRSAICMAGPAPAWAVWWDKNSGGFMSSTHYGSELPTFVSEWNATWREQASGFEWTPSFEGDPTPLGTAADDRPGESPYGEHGICFPYRLSTLDPEVLAGADIEAAAAHLKNLASDVYKYPLGDQFTLQVAGAAVETLKLGQDEHPDLLAVSLSNCDVIGHSFGPYSWEVTDSLLRTDDALGDFLDLLDERVGPGRWVGVLTADHGVLELPETLQARGIGAKRIGPVETGVFTGAVTRALEAAHGVRFKLGFTSHGFSLDPVEVLESGLDPAALRRTMADASVEAHWVAAAYTLEELMGEASPSAAGEEPWLELYRASTYPGRCLDVVLRHEPWVLISSGRGTSHGSPYEYDRDIPLAFLGAAFAAGSNFEPAGSEDILPTFLPLLGLAPLGPVDGRDLLASPAGEGAQRHGPK
jgi:hypothetical protein